MRIGPDTIATLRLEMTQDGIQTQPPRTMNFLYGLDRLLFDLDQRLHGLASGEAATIEFKPFGERRDDLVTPIPLSALAEPPEFALGEWYDCRTNTGEEISFRFLERHGDQLRCDFNHPNAGRTLVVSARVIEVRAATPEELSTASQRCSSS